MSRRMSDTGTAVFKILCEREKMDCEVWQDLLLSKKNRKIRELIKKKILISMSFNSDNGWSFYSRMTGILSVYSGILFWISV